MELLGCERILMLCLVLLCFSPFSRECNRQTDRQTERWREVLCCSFACRHTI